MRTNDFKKECEIRFYTIRKLLLSGMENEARALIREIEEDIKTQQDILQFERFKTNALKSLYSQIVTEERRVNRRR